MPGNQCPEINARKSISGLKLKCAKTHSGEYIVNREFDMKKINDGGQCPPKLLIYI
jgi:hypothetical protein